MVAIRQSCTVEYAPLQPKRGTKNNGSLTNKTVCTIIPNQEGNSITGSDYIPHNVALYYPDQCLTFAHYPFFFFLLAFFASFKIKEGVGSVITFIIDHHNPPFIKIFVLCLLLGNFLLYLLKCHDLCNINLKLSKVVMTISHI